MVAVEAGGVTMDKSTTLICVAALLKMINIDTGFSSLSGNICGSIGHGTWPKDWVVISQAESWVGIGPNG